MIVTELAVMTLRQRDWCCEKCARCNAEAVQKLTEPKLKLRENLKTISV